MLAVFYPSEVQPPDLRLAASGREGGLAVNNCQRRIFPARLASTPRKGLHRTKTPAAISRSDFAARELALESDRATRASQMPMTSALRNRD